jgi:hypothetical protein
VNKVRVKVSSSEFHVVGKDIRGRNVRLSFSVLGVKTFLN